MTSNNELVSGVILAADTMSADELLSTVLRLEALGYDTAWVTDMYGREIYVTASWLLARTSRIRIASGIAHIYGRDAIASAQAGRTLSELSGCSTRRAATGASCPRTSRETSASCTSPLTRCTERLRP